MTNEEKPIYKRIDEILWFDWDPIGVNDTEQARDEYQSYIPRIFSLKINGGDKETIAQHLYKIETDNMGLGGNINNCRIIADKIVNV